MTAVDNAGSPCSNSGCPEVVALAARRELRGVRDGCGLLVVIAVVVLVANVEVVGGRMTGLLEPEMDAKTVEMDAEPGAEASAAATGCSLAEMRVLFPVMVYHAFCRARRRTECRAERCRCFA